MAFAFLPAGLDPQVDTEGGQARLRVLLPAALLLIYAVAIWGFGQGWLIRAVHGLIAAMYEAKKAGKGQCRVAEP